jgi:tRNA A-37 threonylcarbamoyl transferase component Bud32
MTECKSRTRNGWRLTRCNRMFATYPVPSRRHMRAPPGLTSGLFAGRYAIERLLGEGATATVHLARDTERGISVAVKVLRPELVESAATDRFLKEIRRTTRLHHPHILPVLDSGEYEGQPYVVFPYMEGGTLRTRLRREHQLDLLDALAIAQTIGEALDYAHARGLIHRDVKPENILFTNGQAVLGDFGIAHVMETVYGEATSSSGVIRGTVAYMSPEQAAGSRDCDGRSDIYSLACVIYEMITGMQAFIGPTPQSVIAQRFAFTPREVRVYRPTAPPAIEAVFAKAFAMVPTDRYQTAGELVRALREGVTPALSRTVEGSPKPAGHVAPWKRWQLISTSMFAVALAAVIGAMAIHRVRTNIGDTRLQGTSAGTPLDAERFAVLPVETDHGTTPTVDVAELLRESLRRWHGITLVDAFQIRDAIARDSGRLSHERNPRRIAATLGAGRYVRTQTSRLGDSLSVRAALFDTWTGSLLAEKGIRLATSFARADSRMAVLADSLLFHVGTVRRFVEPGGTRSFAARQAYLRGHAALTRWDLPTADSEFAAAVDDDPQYTQAHLWLAQVRNWKGEPSARWRFAAERAAAIRSRMSRRDSLLSTALLSLASGRREEACRYWTTLTLLDTYDFAAWYSLGNCLAFDSAVVRDGRGQWRFRSSYRRALDAYEQAFRLLPSIHRSFRGGSFEDVQRLLKTSQNSLRAGRALPPDTTRFVAYPAWMGDSLGFVPLPVEQIEAAGASGTLPATVNEAVLHQRRRFYEIATMWRAAYPNSPDALHAVAASLDLLGDVSAFDSLRAARRLATDADDRMRIGVLEVWMRVKVGIPSNLRILRDARALADSLLKTYRPSTAGEARLLGSLAALLGKADLAASYAKIAETNAAPPAVVATAAALVAYAAFGGPSDSLRQLERRIGRLVVTNIVEADRAKAQFQWLLRAALLAVPSYRFDELPGIPDKTMHAQLLAAWQAHDLALAHRVLGNVRQVRRAGALRASDLTTDALYFEAAILASLGDQRGAISWLDPTLDSLSLAASGTLADGVRAAALVRAMTLRAELAYQAGDSRTARKWAAAVVLLWSDADPFLTPRLNRIRRLMM